MKPVTQLTDDELRDENAAFERLADADPDSEAPSRYLEVIREVIRRERTGKRIVIRKVRF